MFWKTAVNISVIDKGTLKIKNIISKINNTIANAFCLDKSFDILLLETNKIFIVKKSNIVMNTAGIMDLSKDVVFFVLQKSETR